MPEVDVYLPNAPKALYNAHMHEGTASEDGVTSRHSPRRPPCPFDQPQGIRMIIGKPVVAARASQRAVPRACESAIWVLIKEHVYRGERCLGPALKYPNARRGCTRRHSQHDIDPGLTTDAH